MLTFWLTSNTLNSIASFGSASTSNLDMDKFYDAFDTIAAGGTVDYDDLYEDTDMATGTLGIVAYISKKILVSFLQYSQNWL